MSLLLALAAAAAAAPLPFLAGEWQGTGDYARVAVDYRSIANDLATVERWRTASGRETMTVYVADPSGLTATHYCGQGNVASLRATSVAADRVIFDLASARGVDKGEGVLVRLVLERDGNRLRRTETYRADGRDSIDVIDFVARPGTPPPSDQAR